MSRPPPAVLVRVNEGAREREWEREMDRKGESEIDREHREQENARKSKPARAVSYAVNKRLLARGHRAPALSLDCARDSSFVWIVDAHTLCVCVSRLCRCVDRGSYQGAQGRTGHRSSPPGNFQPHTLHTHQGALSRTRGVRH